MKSIMTTCHVYDQEKNYVAFDESEEKIKVIEPLSKLMPNTAQKHHCMHKSLRDLCPQKEQTHPPHWSLYMDNLQVREGCLSKWTLSYKRNSSQKKSIIVWILYHVFLLRISAISIFTRRMKFVYKHIYQFEDGTLAMHIYPFKLYRS